MSGHGDGAQAGRRPVEGGTHWGARPGLWIGLGVLLCLLAAVPIGLGVADSDSHNRYPWGFMLVAALLGSGGVSLLVGGILRHEARRRSERLRREVSEQVDRAMDRRNRGERSRLLNAVAHDIRQPLYAIGLAAQSLRRPRSPDHLGHMLDQLGRALESADALLDTINTVALLEIGAIQPRLSVFSVQPMLERLDRLYGPQARDRGLHWTVTPSLEMAHTDAALLERMLGHLIANAVRCTPRGGVLVSCRRRGAQLLFQVWDTGPGMGDGELATVFEPHFRGQARTETDSGVGLGLSIVHHAADLLGIDLGVRSRVGHGTCFSLRVTRGELVGPIQLAA